MDYEGNENYEQDYYEQYYCEQLYELSYEQDYYEQCYEQYYDNEVTVTRNTCEACRAMECLKAHNIWVHDGTGNYTKETVQMMMSELTIDHKSGTVQKPVLFSASNYFTERELDLPLFKDGYTGHKPSRVLWFSRGDWMFDSFCDSTHDEHHHNLQDHEVVMIQNPVNILEIKTFRELVEFNEKYSVQQLHNFMRPTINWNLVKEDGYYGVSFDFRKVHELQIDADLEGYDLMKLDWHSGFDVHSLCVWDLRAFDNTVFPVHLKIV